MIEETTFSYEDIKEFVNINYNLIVDKIEKIDRGSANIFSLNNNQYILKEFQSKYTEEDIIKETTIVNHLEKNGIKVPHYIKTINGKLFANHCGKIVILQKFIDGYTIESNTATYSQMIESANMLGQICKSLKDLELNLEHNDVTLWCNSKHILSSISKTTALKEKVCGDYKDKILKDLDDKVEMSKEIIQKVNFDDFSKLTNLNTHGDYSLMQFIYKDNKINAVIDFVSACKMPIVWEIIRSYSYIDEKAKDGVINIDNLTDYVKEFCKFVKLNKYDLKMMPYIYLIQLLNSLFGYKQYIENNNQIELLNFAFFRTNLCRYLYAHAEEISQALEKIL